MKREAMRIIVPIKQVPETNAVKMDETTGTMIREGVEAIINPLDLYAIEAAILLREQYGGEAIAVTMGPSKSVTALREAIAMGIDRAVLLSNKAFAGSDTWATSRVLSAAIRQLGRSAGPANGGCDLIVCGERATDGDTGQVGPGIASFLNLPVATYISRIEKVDGNVCRVHRLVEGGYEILDVELPAVLTVVKEAANPRLPTLRGKQRARKIEIPTWGPEDLALPMEDLGLKGSPTRVVKIFRPKITRQGRKVPAGDPEAIGAAVDQLLEFLRKRELL
jgi:electron transfer flavoprotein beta subunit